MIYKDIKDNSTFSKFINDNVDALIYVVDMNTHEVLYSNQKTIDEFGLIDGFKCYKKLQKNQLEPCAFCPSLKIKNLIDNHKTSYTWEHHNTLNNKIYLFRDLIVTLDDKLVKVQVGIDITKEKKLEEDLIKEKNYSINSFEALTNATIEGLIISDLDKNCIQVNDTISQILGYHKEEMISRNILEFVSSKSKELVINFINETNNESHEIVLLRKDGSSFPALFRAKKINLSEKTIYVIAILDITIIKEKEKKIKSLAYYDSLTSLANRTLLLNRVELFMNLSERNKNYASLLFIDLDHFKVINDLRGHLFGDILLQQCAQRLSNVVRKTDTVSRFGGDEFVILLDTQTFDEKKAVGIVENIASKILYELSKVFIIEGSEFKISASIGVTMFSGNSKPINCLLKYADNAMYQSKKSGRGVYTFFNEELEEKNERRNLLVQKLNIAIENNLIEFFYQNQIDRYNKIIGVELLARWEDEQLGKIDTSEFITLAIEIGIIKKLDEMVLNEAAKLIKKWENDIDKKELLVSINVSLEQFERDDFTQVVNEIFKKYNTPFGKLRIEITENLFQKNEEKVFNKINKLKELGVKLSIDDFATGYFSLPYLKRISVDEIKIDKQFVKNILVNENDEAIVLAILEIAKKFNFKVIVEGVETKEIFDKLLGMGCDNFQGYYISLPKSLKEK